MIRVVIIGDGYTAADLVRILSLHEKVRITAVTSVENVGAKLSELYPSLTGLVDITLQETDLDQLKTRADAAFLALPHGLSVPIVAELVESGIKCVDLGADFRLKDVEVYKKHYQLEHGRPDLLREAVYGLPEIYRQEVKTARIVANPGCYPTGAILGLAPLLRTGLISSKGIIVDSKSGVTGAGRGLSRNTHFCEVNEGFKAYGVGNHRHAPEIEQELSAAAGEKISITFTPHLVPMSRGILTTAYAEMKPGVRPDEIRGALEESYGSERFVKVLPAGTYPQTRWVYGSNYVHIGVFVNPDDGRVIVITAIDNLTKGASGQAVQNFNLLFGLDEAEALKAPAIYP
ncbi:MAG: N-acetyl-gamma-glutamyl-phosphate reductase [Syntrophomonadaceae bacterium]|nr:N-acetyl-gamma-glutamyl-phosphate reductase [Syntrophomonadaceae bacterium]